MRPCDCGGVQLWDFIKPGVDKERPKDLNPYEKLLLALLLDAIATLQKPKSHGCRRPIPEKYKVKGRLNPVADAWNWIMSDDEDWCLNFAVICQHFNWDHTWVRKKALEAIQKAQESKPQACSTLRGESGNGRVPVNSGSCV